MFSRFSLTAVVVVVALLSGDTQVHGQRQKVVSHLEIPSSVKGKKREKLEKAKKIYLDAMDSLAKPMLKAAEGALKRARSAVPESPIPHYYLGILYKQRGNYRKSLASLDKALELAPDFYQAHRAVGDVEVSRGELEASLDPFRRALEIHPRYSRGLSALFQALVALRRYDEALPIAKRALAEKDSRVRKRWVYQLETFKRGENWENSFVVESENYVMRSNVSQEFTQQLSESIELIREVYDKIFPEIPKPDRKYLVICYRNKAEYEAAYAMPKTLGYYDSTFRQLNLYQQGELKDTLMTLKHEGFHQYCHEYLDRIPQWFNEGLADYFAASRPVLKNGKRKMQIIPNSRRLKTIAEAIRKKEYPSVERLMNMTRKEMYHPRSKWLHYCQAWSVVYFSIDGKGGKYRGAFKDYFRALTSGKSQEDAYKLSFGRLNMKRFETEWRDFIVKAWVDK